MTQLRKTILDLIAANKIGKAIETLRASEAISSNNKIHSAITLLSSRYKSVRENSVKGILSASEIALHEAKINNDILELLDSLEQHPTSLSSNVESPYTSNVASQKTKFNPLIGFGGLFLIVLISFLVWNQMDGKKENHSNETGSEISQANTEVNELTPEIKKPEPVVLLPRKFRIEPKTLQMVNGDDGSGGDPEVYGEIKMGVGKKGMRNNLKTIFNRKKSNYLTMKEGQLYPTDATGDFLEIEVSPEGEKYLLDQYEFFLSADLTESDDGGFLDPDDRIGEGQIIKSLQDLADGGSQPFVLEIKSPEGNVIINTIVSEVKN